jgi:hypothetical protein
LEWEDYDVVIEVTDKRIIKCESGAPDMPIFHELNVKREKRKR